MTGRGLIASLAGMLGLINSDYSGSLPALKSKENSGFSNSKNRAFTKGKRHKSLKVRANRRKAKK